MAIENALKTAGITLPTPAKAAANYLPFVVHQGLVQISGQLPMRDGALAYHGKVTSEAMIAEAQAAARLCGVNLLAQLREACGGDWTKFDRALRLGIFINAPAGFHPAPTVANGVSDLMVEILGDKGRHARSTVCVAELPFGAMVEVEGLFALK
jgi:enamine deaminase RidA (YjgF/YER057c/UK114 family)